MIRVKEIEDMINKKKDTLIKTMQGSQLEDALAKLQAEKQLELSLVEDKLKIKQLEEDSAIRVKQEKTFGEEKKDLHRHCQMLKKDKLKEVMELFKEEPLVIEIGAKMIKRIDATLDDQMKEIDDITEKKLEEARLRIVAENEEELA
jgi:FKBP-type peptidyl-prolyl cis-trans isomerase 2